MTDKLDNKDTPEKTAKLTKLNLKFDEMMISIQKKEIKLDTIPEGSKKDIIIGIQEAVSNDKLIKAARALYTNYQLVRAFVPIIFKMYMRS
jgi:predicted DNA-binding helix-hairpin-helix protein|tara:strand:+ start:153 stop:425 length:273 start_codon:yes stop_codon:yes gene_type:complete